MVTASPSMHWAEKYLREEGQNALAAVIRGDKLFILTLTRSLDGSKRLPFEVYMVYMACRPGGIVEGTMAEIKRTEDGCVLFYYAWIEGVQPADYEELLDCLTDAQRRLDFYTEPDQRLDRVIELARWSDMASSGDFSSLDHLEPQSGAD